MFALLCSWSRLSRSPQAASYPRNRASTSCSSPGRATGITTGKSAVRSSSVSSKRAGALPSPWRRRRHGDGKAPALFEETLDDRTADFPVVIPVALPGDEQDVDARLRGYEAACGERDRRE